MYSSNSVGRYKRHLCVRSSNRSIHVQSVTIASSIVCDGTAAAAAAAAAMGACRSYLALKYTFGLA